MGKIYGEESEAGEERMRVLITNDGIYCGRQDILTIQKALLAIRYATVEESMSFSPVSGLTLLCRQSKPGSIFHYLFLIYKRCF